MLAFTLALSTSSSVTISSILTAPRECEFDTPDLETASARPSTPLLLPAAMVPLGWARDDPKLRELEPLVDEYRAKTKMHRGNQRRASSLLVDLLLRQSDGHALTLPESEGVWGKWGLSVLRWMGLHSQDQDASDSAFTFNYKESDDALPPPDVPTLPELPVNHRPRRYPLVRRTQSSPGPYSAQYPAANSYLTMKHRFTPPAPRRRLSKPWHPHLADLQTRLQRKGPLTSRSTSGGGRQNGLSCAPSRCSPSEHVSPGEWTVSHRSRPSSASRVVASPFSTTSGASSSVWRCGTVSYSSAPSSSTTTGNGSDM